MPAIGLMRRRVTLQTRSQAAVSGTGGLTDTYATEATVWAEVVTLSGGRYVASRQTEQVATHRVTIRWRQDWREITWIRHESARLRVQSGREADDRRRFVELLCEEETEPAP